MPEAVGVIQTLGFPGVLAAADAMVKAAQVTLVQFDLAERGEFMVSIRGRTSEVVPAMEAGIAAAEKVFGCTIITHYIVPNPPENLEAVMPIDYTEVSQMFRP
ncbi:MAG: BMC domain-containing protein [Oscillatoriales cyanobacterium RM2_1_1]|nr:BMC domain-containing protein [Oscillatoriales cyanobacterium SM2_3_0]NJO47194.1 BMC domain-containing protein [Oscillatoriales cyanobacterium RM2_1_1]